MGFGRSRRPNWGRDDSKKGKSRPKLALAGVIVLLIGILVNSYGGNIGNQNIISGSVIVVGIAALMLFFSLSKRYRIMIAKGIERTKKTLDPCQCCKCTNCGRNHNHWTHDEKYSK